MKDQMTMIYDIVEVHEHSKIQKEFVIAILFSKLGNTAFCLVIVHWRKFIPEKVGVRVH